MPDEAIFVDVLCVGNASYDLTFTVPHHPDKDEKLFASSLVRSGGGPAANAAVTVCRLGHTAAFAGYLGLETFGDRHLAEFTDEGVVTDLIVRGSAPTPLSAVMAKPDGTRALVNYRGRTEPLRFEEIDFSRIYPKVILFDGHEPALSLPLAEEARRRGIVTVLDAGSIHQGAQALIGLVDYLVCSQRFALEFTGMNQAEQALPLLVESAPVVVITLGEEGVIWQTGHIDGRLPAYPEEVVDSTGAGDTFHGAFCVALIEGMNLDKAIEFASAAAALCCTKVGARPGIPTRDATDRFLAALAG